MSKLHKLFGTGWSGEEERFEHASTLPAPTAFRVALEAMVECGCTALGVNHPLEQVGHFDGLASATGEGDGVELTVTVPPGHGGTVTVTGRGRRGVAQGTVRGAVRAVVGAVIQAERDREERMRAAGTVEKPGRDRPVIWYDVLRATGDGRYGDARRFAQELWEAGDARGALQLALLHSQGLGGPESPAVAACWYTVAAQAGNADGAYGMGALHALGRGVVHDWEQAFGWYRRAAELGDADAAFRVAAMYDQGQGVPADRAEAGRWLCRAADLYAYRKVSVQAVVALAGELAMGRDGPEDIPGGARLLLRLALAPEGDRGITAADREEAMDALAELMPHLKTLADTGDAAAAAVLGWALVQGGAEHGEEVGLELLCLATTHDDPAAKRWLGVLLRDGHQLLDADPSGALACWQAAADAGDREACLLLGRELHRGALVAPDVHEAERLLRAAGDLPEARFELAVLLGETNRRVERAEQLRLAAEGRHAGAMVLLGDAYRDGDGLASDPFQAVRWYLAALHHGDGDGLHDLHRLAAGLTGDMLLDADRQAGGDGTWAVTLTGMDRSGDGDACDALVAAYETRFGPLAITHRAARV